MHTIAERGIDVALVSEPFLKKGRGRWAINGNGTAGIWVKDPQSADMIMKEDGITGVEIQGVNYYSLYFSGNRPAVEYNEFLNTLGRTLREKKKKIVAAGDLNAKSPMWGEDGGRDRAEK
ncbi:uncharacterized protein [Bemisia tabaci]|uniref:uncharacterized protein n=1 Tax=Bemisia tabaci TaxID=7038 RepID=UPI003B28CF10